MAWKRNIKSVLKKAIMIWMIVAISFLPVKKAEAACDPFGLIGSMFTTLSENVQDLALHALQQVLIALIIALITEATGAVIGDIGDLEEMILGALRDSAEDQVEDWRRMTKQISAAALDNARQTGSGFDSDGMSEDIARLGDEEISAVRDYTPDDYGRCIAGTFSGHIGRGEVVSSGALRTLNHEFITRSLNGGNPNNPNDQITNIGLNGTMADIKLRYNAYKKIFCDKEFSKGRVVCDNGETAWENADTAVGTWLTGRSTFLVDDFEERLAMRNLSWSFAEPVIDDPVPASAVATSDEAKIRLLARRAETAQRAAAAGAINYAIADRMESTQATQWVEGLLQKSGIDMADIDLGRDPGGNDDRSLHEAREVLMKLRFFTPESVLRSTSKSIPELEQEEIVLKTQSLSMLYRQYRQLERIVALTALDASRDIQSIPSFPVVGKSPVMAGAP